MDQDQPLPRTIKIGKANIGLVNFDQAMTQALQNDKNSVEEAVNFIFSAIKDHNYIPSTAHELYKEAIKREYLRHKTGSAEDPDGLKIRILGPGCVSCNQIKTMLIDIMQEMGFAADIEQVKDLDEIWRYGVLNTPALLINNEVKSTGRLPSRSELEAWLREIAN